MLFNTERILLIKIVSAERIHCTKAAEKKFQVKIAWNERRLQIPLKYIKEPTHLNGIHGGQRVFSVVGVFSGSGSTQLR